MTIFEEQYNLLNTAQKLAVDMIEGPLLVIAGPGTGKTQLLSARVANILLKTDTLPRNILCLTFTESGAENMRERLTRFIGQSAYDVTISTYHAFGSDIMYRFPQYFTAAQLQNPVDQLGKHQIVSDIVDTLSYSNPLKQLRHHLGDLLTTISEVKRALLTPESLRALAKENTIFITSATTELLTTLEGLSVMPRTTAKALPVFNSIHQVLTKIANKPAVDTAYGSLAELAHHSLTIALEEAQASGKTTSLTAWKNQWLIKDADNHYVFNGVLENQRINALADVLEHYQQALAEQGLYDFDDMIIRVIDALENHSEFAYTLQEQYLYILLDEFQDTNAAQLRLVELLTNNPVHEGRPNVMAVGDDDQAIYAFQGAQYSNMIDFYNLYHDVSVVNLTVNYRSHQHIIDAASAVTDQIGLRLHQQFSGMRKDLIAASAIADVNIIRQELLSDVAQYDWVAQKVRQLIEQGIPPHEIAVLAPKHRYIEPLVAYLNELAIPVQYEKREDILDAPVIKQIIQMAKLVLALHEREFDMADALWPEILSYDFWHIPVQDIWNISWNVNDNLSDGNNWTKYLLDTESCRLPALLFASLALKSQSETCEVMIDYLLGSLVIKTGDSAMPEVRSPLRDYYTSEHMRIKQPECFYQVITELKVLQTKLREHQNASGHTLLLSDLINFVAMYDAAGEPMLNTSPYHQQSDAVQLMTVFKAKGLEFEHVFLLSCHDDVWGSSSHGKHNTLTLPANLTPIRHAGTSDDERLRVLFVAMTRAKSGLYLTSYLHTFGGKKTKRLKYIDEQEQADGSFRAMILPPEYQTVLSDIQAKPSLEIMETDWRSRHFSAYGDVDVSSMLRERLKRYQLSPTHLNQFIDLRYTGPYDFLFRTVLRFPQAPTASSQFGNAIHQTLEWYQYIFHESKKAPSIASTIAQFDEYISRKRLSEHDIKQLTERGHIALQNYLRERAVIFTADDAAETNFSHEGVFIDNVHLTGKIDRMEIDQKSKQITVVDYKTGSPHVKWATSDIALHKYKQQLYCYKLLIEGSHSYAGYTVNTARLEFIEPNRHGQIQSLILEFDSAEMNRIKQLLCAVWNHIQRLDFPDTQPFKSDITGIIAFEDWLIEHAKTAYNQ